jgi:hypothetical protein
MAQKRKKGVDRRNVTLHIETYDRLDKFLLGLMQERNKTKVSMNDAIEALLDEHYSKA